MKYLVLALPFLALPAAAWADDPCLPTRMSLDDETRPRQEQETDVERPRPEDTNRLSPMEFIFRHSHLEAGALYTEFDSGLTLKSHLGYYVRWGVELAPRISAHVTFRYNEFGNSPTAVAVQEDIRIQTLLFGASYHYPLMRDFGLEVGLAFGPTWWESSVVKNDLGLTVSAEFGVTARLYELVHFKAGFVYDASSTNFHSASGLQSNLSWLFGFELGL
jgi:hypothetical protein